MFFLIGLQRHPDIGDFRKTPAARHDSDDAPLLSVNRNNFTENIRVASEMIAPGVITEQRHRRGFQLIFFRAK